MLREIDPVSVVGVALAAAGVIAWLQLEPRQIKASLQDPGMKTISVPAKPGAVLPNPVRQEQ